MFGRAAQQQKQIDHLQAQVRGLEALVGELAGRAGVGEAELRQLRDRSGRQIPAECRRLVDEGRTIEAIKVYREHTGAGLKDAKDAIDRYREREG
ncbi:MULTISPECIES: hypothetical protein [Brachybacterium]|uniref:Ribosomal protein L7/L12 C-terminal domain-containing protein n=2 Tax=Brachybacterium alimentarium TaxID=47845 RepID=A0A2A3YGK2_9MICO|nr:MULTISPECIES: hypothetical protein [Brachybacterium]PCC38424.1 hypothetical protein CIK66_14025 [Brachybacterium alimentarium]RCS66147.1 hypothetical protein CIK81_02740 [Brachybacterium sp. JB7]RCS67803.1 hypothetical protein CIK73_09585 [Brachybacterium alimentarium]RCS77987.1 hypothetical protein CIK72_12420 [Brachybacterium alimentarium]RCS86209.1 hypothetical protein CIK69_15805 [Brachybacterium alimentarium]